MTYGPPPGNPSSPPGQPGGGYGPPPGGQPGGYGQPPQGGGYGQPAQYGPPPSQYGPPTGPYPTQRSGFDFASVNPLDWAIIGAGVLAFIFSFFQYYTADAKGELKAACDQGQLSGTSCSDTAGAWHGFFGWFGVLLLLVAAAITAVAVFMPHLRAPFSLRLVALGFAAVGLIFTFIALFVTPTPEGVPSGINIDKYVDYGRGFSYWIILVLALGATALCVMRYQQTGGNFATLFNRRSQQGAPGGYGYGQPQTYGAAQQTPPGGYQQPGYQPPQQQPQGPPPGYQQPQQPYQPPAQQGYGPPQGPPPGYQQPQGPPPGYQPPQAPPPAYQPPQAPPPAFQPPQAPPSYQPPPAPPGYQPEHGQEPPAQQPPQEPSGGGPQ